LALRKALVPTPWVPSTSLTAENCVQHRAQPFLYSAEGIAVSRAGGWAAPTSRWFAPSLWNSDTTGRRSGGPRGREDPWGGGGGLGPPPLPAKR